MAFGFNVALALAALHETHALRKSAGSAGSLTESRLAAATKFISGVPMLEQELAQEGHRDWMAFFPSKTSDEVLATFCENSGAEACFAGHPDEGGVPFVSFRTSEPELEGLLARNAGASFVVPDVEIDEIEEPDEVGAMASPTWGVDRIGARRSSSTGKGVNVYVLDSGVRCSHQEFGDRCIPTTEYRRWGGLKECNGDMGCAKDGRGHGTHCAGSVGAATYGVAPGATIRAQDRGSSWSHAYASMDWVIQKGARPAVVSMSFGTQKILSGGDVAVNKVVDAGITVVVAAGNWKSDSCGFSFAYVPSAIAVGATAPGDERAGFSNFGSCNTIMAPGAEITSTDYSGDTATSTKSGTSMACPHTSGAIALILERNPSYSPQKVKEALLSNAEQGVISGLKQGDPDLFLRIV